MDKLYVVLGRKYGTTEWHLIPRTMTGGEAMADAKARFVKNRGLNNGLGYEYQIATLSTVNTWSSNGKVLSVEDMLAAK